MSQRRLRGDLMGSGSARAPKRRVEEIGRSIASQGVPVYFQPTVAHRHAAAPAVIFCLAAAGLALSGLLFPLPAIVALLAILLAAVRDADGGQSWLRALLPRRPGWTAEIELQGQPVDGPTLILWAPIAGRAYGRLHANRTSRALLATPAVFSLLACVGLALAPKLAPEFGRAVAVGSALGLVLSALTVAVLLRPGPPLPPEVDPAEWVRPLVSRLTARPLEGVRLLVLVGSEGAVWNDDLAVTLINRRHRYKRQSALLLAVEPGPGPLAVVDREGLVIMRPAASELTQALAPLGLPTTAGRTGAARARALGLQAIGLQGTETHPGQGPRHLEMALRYLAGHLAPEST